MIIKFESSAPQIDQGVYISPGTFIIGAVTVRQDSSIWFGSVIRGDVAGVYIGARTNIQDGTIIHTSRFNGSTYIGNDVTIGHRAVIHACTISDNAFIGMSATVMDKAVIEPFGFVAAGALVSPGKVVSSKQLWAGVPAKYIRDLTDQEIEHIIESAEHYVRLSKKYLTENHLE
jgi:carbonic anhydrase/acetyltransferase-like protein (isoleucine patch superfamily)